jgi:hypothetical protein
MSDANINAMNLSQLKNEVQMLRDELAIMQRKYEDILYNLDDNNFSTRIVQEKQDMKTAISVTAEGIETKVSKEEFESQVAQTAERISSIVSKNISAYFESEDDPNYIDTTPKQKSMLCLYGGVYYYYDDFSRKWRDYPADGLQTMFEQTATGFKLTGSVEITEVAQVNKQLSIGDKGDNSEKYIYFSSGANIHTYADFTGNPPSGIALSGSSVMLDCPYLDLTLCSEIYWGNNAVPAVFA